MAKKKQSAKPDSNEDISFEQSLEKLEQIVQQLEEGGQGLSQSLAQYEEGVSHLNRCYEALRRAERRVELLAGVDADGNPVVEPYEDEASTLEEKQQSRSRRRSKSTPRSGNSTSEVGDADVDESGGLF